MKQFFQSTTHLASPFAAASVALLFCVAAASAAPRCPFDETALSFEGAPVEQARCLLRPVKQGAVLGEALAKLPAPLEDLIGKPVRLDKAKFESYLWLHHISTNDIGGSPENSLASKYFVIHDVSAPNYLDKPFPPDINEPTWRLNKAESWKKSTAAHIFVTRTGESTTSHPFTTPWRATKFEVKILGEKSRGLFVHIELVQPRRSDPKGRKGNDAIAPTPGFTEKQLDRLALLYVNASLMHGAWMIPAYHAALDTGIPDGHDDPQNFDLAQWAHRLELLLKSIETADEKAK